MHVRAGSGKRMSDIHIDDLMKEFGEGRSIADLIRSAAGVANGIHVGIGGMIKGTMMEEEFRKALGLEHGQMVILPKPKTLRP